MFISNNSIDIFSLHYSCNKKIIICLHPKTNLETYKKYLGAFELCKFQTTENIRQAFIVVFHASTAIYEAIFLKKKIISLKSNALGEFMTNLTNYQQKFDLCVILRGIKGECGGSGGNGPLIKTPTVL